MAYTYKDIQDSERFRLLLKLDQNEIVAFVLRYIKKNNTATRLFYFLNILVILLLIRDIVFSISQGEGSIGKILLYCLYGLLIGMIVVIPFHEGIHGLAYRLAGAKKIKFGADFTQMIFFVTADRFVVGKKRFFIVALSPFIIIGGSFITGYIFSAFYCKWMFLVALICHSSMCMGDFAFMSFFQEHPEKELYTYDEPEHKLSFVYERVE